MLMVGEGMESFQSIRRSEIQPATGAEEAGCAIPGALIN